MGFINHNNENIVTSEEYLDHIVEYEKDNLMNQIKEYNPVRIQIINDNYAIFHISTEGEAENPIENFPALYGPYDKSVMDAANVLTLHNHPYVPLRGTGVLIGIVDSGIDYTHRVFTYEDNTTKIQSIWDQTIDGDPPQGFIYGTEFDMEDINRALQSDEPYSIVPSRDMTGHGTSLAGIAAGREVIEEDFVGAAPGSELIVVKLKEAKKYFRSWWMIEEEQTVYQSSDIMMGVRYLYQKAQILRKPLSIIVGLGSNQGSHDGTSILEEYLGGIAIREENVVTIAAGNEANLGHHYKAIFEDGENYKNVELNVVKGEKGFVVSIWSKTPDKISIALTTPSGEYIERLSPLIKKQDIKLTLEQTIIEVFYQLSNPRTGDQVVFVKLITPTEGIWTITVFADLMVNGRIDLWLPREGWIKKETTFLQPDSYTTVTVPGTSVDLITSGAYDAKTNTLYINSGRGLTRDNELKPDLVAPGVNVKVPLPANTFATKTGTSISSAIVGGVSALLLEWGIVLGNDLQMDTRKAKNYLLRGAARDEERIYPNREWGYGKVNLLGTFEDIGER